MRDGPVEGSYWVEPGRLLAGPYPEPGDDAAALAAAGVTATVDLTRADEGLPDYWSAEGLDHRRIGLQDFAPPAAGEMTAALGAVAELLEHGDVVYLHCRGGLGRTGCVVACRLVEAGEDPEAALAHVAEWRRSPHSPETEEQRGMVRGWPR